MASLRDADGGSMGEDRERAESDRSEVRESFERVRKDESSPPVRPWDGLLLREEDRCTVAKEPALEGR